MFQKKEVIYSETIGVCVVDDIVKLADSRKDTYSYYLLRSVYDRQKKAYIPVDHHAVRLRRLMTKEEAKKLRDEEGFDEKSEQVKGEVAYLLREESD